MRSTAPDIICAGEMLVEIMRAEVGVPHAQVGAVYRGPFPSGAPRIFVEPCHGQRSDHIADLPGGRHEGH